MLEDNIDTKDSITAEVNSAEKPPVKTYIVTSEAGLFKNGKQYDKGTEVELNETAAANFKELGDIKDA